MGKSAKTKSLEEQLTAAQLERARKDFERYDTNGDGTLSTTEFRKALEPYLTPEDLKALMKEVNPNADGKISWTEFLDDYVKDL
ncbi:EF-hand domain-containing protein [Pseudomonas glycinae]|uniref:EF-hand domain-containing protein n=1 Tax=Pseudomonas glycinae TaxID=1785145 RepID=A0ABM6QHU9_9PSED|nr:EF-hand domain-containing protein [Pseudomonas glycinae]AMQ85283.1 EF-hand domain-containing protein [Pseudomonas glycinae]AUG97530.1 EF-hand domain-containing protein [Pseudomonas glycinae]NKF26326.1 EF-hand domain-containing protein [Pseudomonas sp. BG5]